MTRLQFIAKMKKLKSNDMTLVGDERTGVCHMLKGYLGVKAVDYFRETFCPVEDYSDVANMAYFLAYNVGKNGTQELVDLRKPQVVREVRLNAIVMFEAQVLAYGLYKGF